tara:strand:- start:9882 stop:11111 length:1230 start_codon:yes stop_codon:yes gene_type:complete
MAHVLNPSSTTSAISLPATGSHTDVANLPFGVYESDEYFTQGAVDQVAHTFAQLGGNVLDIELTTHEVYSSYEEAVLEYSYMVNSHQAKNVLMSVLGYTTGTFNQDGEIISGTNISQKYPDYSYGFSKRVATAYSSDVGVGGNHTMYSASIDVKSGKQDYNLDDIVLATGSFKNPSERRKIVVKDVYYRSPMAMWRFFGFYGNMSMVGNMNSYGQYSDDSVFHIVPVWQNKAQAMSYEDALHTRTSHYSYELINNHLRLYPIPRGFTSPDIIWVRYMIPRDPWTSEEDDRNMMHDGINNINTIPLANIPYQNINSIGKHWIRRYALAITKGILAQVRGKVGAIPIPNGTVTLNSAELSSQSKEEKSTLKQELQKLLDEMVYSEVAKREAEAGDAAMNALRNSPGGIYVG